MNKQIVAIILGIFLISLTSAFSICIDHTPPSPPSNLVLTASGKNIQLTWNPATDEPACSGIDFYDIYRGFNGGVLSWIANTSSTNYLDETLAYGTYEYIIHAWDLAGHNEGNGTGNSIVLKSGNGDDDNGNGGSGGGGGGGSDNLFSCGKWEECIDGTQIRICENIGRNLPNRTETRNCFPDFIPFFKNPF